MINFRHALKNTLVPVITVTGLQLGAIIAFAIITETVFQWPGVGLLFINAVQFVDIPVMAAYLMLISVMFVGLNLAVDILYVDDRPRGWRQARGAAYDRHQGGSPGRAGPVAACPAPGTVIWPMRPSGIRRLRMISGLRDGSADPVGGLCALDRAA